MSGRLKKGGAVLLSLTALVGSFEGLREYAYRDPVGIPTICFGETRGVKIGDHKTTEQCKAMLGNRLIEFATGVDHCLTWHVPDQVYVSFVSFSYNVGVGAFCHSTLAAKANAHDLTGACKELSKWTRAHGFVLPGLVERRRVERELCLHGVLPT